MVERPGSQFTHGTVQAGEFSLDFAEAGPTDAEVTLVSFPGSAGLEMSTAKDILAREFRVVEINPPGWGAKDDLNRPMDGSEIAALLTEAAHKLVDGRYYIIGTSAGGTVAIYAAAAHLQRVRGIILEGSMSPARPEDLAGPPIDPDAIDAGELPLPPVHPNKPWATTEYMREQMANRFRLFRWLRIDMLPETALATLRDAHLPVLALVGEDDGILQLSQKDAYSQYLPDADFKVIPGGGHDLQNTAPQEFVGLVEQFVKNG